VIPVYFVRADSEARKGSTTWSVYVEQYASLESIIPVSGSRQYVMTCPTKIEADRQAARLQRESYHQARVSRNQ
jgi:hypothetical protein